MTSQEYSRSPDSAGEKIDDPGWAMALAAALLACLARLPALGAYWNQADWELLARASGLIPASDAAVRWLSQSAYWQVLWPLAGLDTVPYAATRIVIHALAAGGVVRLAMRMGLAPAQQWLAGLIIAATPLAFGPLYQAAGVQDLLAVCFMVWSLERWLSPSRTGKSFAALLAIAAVASKETVAGLPVLLGCLLFLEQTGPRKPGARSRRPMQNTWLWVAFAALGSIVAIAQALRFHATGPADVHALGGFFVWSNNLLTYGLWLVLPGPHYPLGPDLALTLIGGLVWLAWAGWSLHQWQSGRRTPALALLGALLMLAPLLPLRLRVAPDLAYPVEPFGCLALACLWPRRWCLRWQAMAALALATWSWGYFGMQGRVSLRTAEGLHADPLVQNTAVSAAASRQIQQLPAFACALVIVQPPQTRPAAVMADQLGEQWVARSILHNSLAGSVGPSMLLAERHRCEPDVSWSNGLRRTPQDAFVMLATDHDLRPWGMTPQALLYQTLTDLGLGLYERAHLHLLRASLVSQSALSFAHDPDLLPVTLDSALANLESFLEYLDQGRKTGRSEEEITGLQTNILRLLSAGTGRDVDDLAPGRAQR